MEGTSLAFNMGSTVNVPGHRASQVQAVSGCPHWVTHVGTAGRVTEASGGNPATICVAACFVELIRHAHREAVTSCSSTMPVEYSCSTKRACCRMMAMAALYNRRNRQLMSAPCKSVRSDVSLPLRGYRHAGGCTTDVGLLRRQQQSPVGLDGLESIGCLNLALDDEAPHTLALRAHLFLRSCHTTQRSGVQMLAFEAPVLRGSPCCEGCRW
jgi:hypothetical protein